MNEISAKMVEKVTYREELLREISAKVAEGLEHIETKFEKSFRQKLKDELLEKVKTGLEQI